MHRPAWVEIDLQKLRHNFEIFLKDKSKELGFISVVKDDAYGHGMVQVAKMAAGYGAKYIAIVNVDEALELKAEKLEAPILIFGERTPEEFKICVQENLCCFVSDLTAAKQLQKIALAVGKQHPVQVEIETGLSRYGVRWTQAMPIIEAVAEMEGLKLMGVMSHFAMSDEQDKTFATTQLERFKEVLAQMTQKKIIVPYTHMCNTGGFLDLPHAHFDLVRIGILPFGVYPSQVCRRIPGLEPVMSVKTKIAMFREIEKGDNVGYGVRYKAPEKQKIAVLPMGYGDGYPRVRNQGEVLIRGKRAPVVGGNAMDAMMVDVTHIPEAQQWDEVVLMGKQGDDEIDVHEIAKLKGSVSYDILLGWRSRLPRVYLNEG